MSKNAPIIVKKINKHAGGHHGGAWKVAYADFVTAMMAFFLLLWLLSMVSDEKKASLSQYFNEFSMFSESGQSMLGQASSMFSESSDLEQQAFDGSSKKTISNVHEIEEGMKKDIAESLEDTGDQVIVDLVDDGVRIQITDREGSQMFERGRKELTSKAKDILKVISGNIKDIPNRIIIDGHTDALQFSGSHYSNWELSTERASQARKLLEDFGLDSSRIARVAGYAHTDPLIKDDPTDARNRRISITIKHPEKPVIKVDKNVEKASESAKPFVKQYKTVADRIKNSVKKKSGDEIDVSLSNNFKDRYENSEDTEKFDSSIDTASTEERKPEIFKDNYFPKLGTNPDLINPVEEAYSNKESTTERENPPRDSVIDKAKKGQKKPRKKTGRSLSTVFDYSKENTEKESSNAESQETDGTVINKKWNPVISQESIYPVNPSEREETPGEADKSGSSLSDNFNYNDNDKTEKVLQPVITKDNFYPVQTEK